VAYTWDNNGNLLSDGATTYSYGPANRLRTVDQGDASYTFIYDGLGNRIQQIAPDGTPYDYTLDLAAGLTQVLDDTVSTYLYGRARIAEEQPEGLQYHLGDALGSVRELTSSTGTVGLVRSYEPFGSVMSSFGSASTAFAFTGEQMDGTGLVYLRARYYSSTQGRFVSADMWEGDALQPMSGNPWAYSLSNPLNYTDPSGRFPTWCQTMPSPALFETCVLASYLLEPISSGTLGAGISGGRGCYHGEFNYRGRGYVEGMSGFIGPVTGGKERVISFATMESRRFSFIGTNFSDSVFGLGVAEYAGAVFGLRSPGSLVADYYGFARGGSVGAGTEIPLELPVGVGGGLMGFESMDEKVRGAAWYVGGGVSADLFPIIEMSWQPVIYYWPEGEGGVYFTFRHDKNKVDRARLRSYILSGQDSPWLVSPGVAGLATRLFAAQWSLLEATIYEELRSVAGGTTDD
jgi:RHS repeat-associated protein